MRALAWWQLLAWASVSLRGSRGLGLVEALASSALARALASWALVSVGLGLVGRRGLVGLGLVALWVWASSPRRLVWPCGLVALWVLASSQLRWEAKRM